MINSLRNKCLYAYVCIIRYGTKKRIQEKKTEAERHIESFFFIKFKTILLVF